MWCKKNQHYRRRCNTSGEKVFANIYRLKFLAVHIYGNKKSPNKTSNNFQIETKITSYPIGRNLLSRTEDTRIIQWLQDKPTSAELKQYSTKDDLKQATLCASIHHQKNE